MQLRIFSCEYIAAMSWSSIDYRNPTRTQYGIVFEEPSNVATIIQSILYQCAVFLSEMQQTCAKSSVVYM